MPANQSQDAVVSLHTDFPVARIVLNSPERRNALNTTMWRLLEQRVSEAAKDPRIKAIVICGAGGYFSAGADITEFDVISKSTEAAQTFIDSMSSALRAIETICKPTIAEIRGACVGGGCSIACACDFRFATTASKFGVTPSKLGLVYSGDDTRRLTALVGQSAAKELLYGAQIIKADVALSLGLCDRIYSEDELDNGVADFAALLASRSQYSLRSTKSIMRLVANGQASGTEAARIMLESFSNEDFKEGYRAFLEGRKPKF